MIKSLVRIKSKNMHVVLREKMCEAITSSLFSNFCLQKRF